MHLSQSTGAQTSSKAFFTALLLWGSSERSFERKSATRPCLLCR